MAIFLTLNPLFVMHHNDIMHSKYKLLNAQPTATIGGAHYRFSQHITIAINAHF